MFSGEYCETFKTSCFFRAPLAAASEIEEIRDNSLHQLQPQMTHINNQENVTPQNIFNSLVHMYESSESHFFKIFIRKPLGLNVFVESSRATIFSLGLKSYRSSRPEVLYKKSVLKNFLKLTGKHLFQCLFFKYYKFV